MKLSMWMLANRLSSFDLELHIEEKAPMILNSARRVYATNCVHVYPEANYVVCNGEGNLIKIFNMNVTQAFEIVQGVFDYYQDWMDQTAKALHEKNYQEIINLSYPIFHNPLILFDGNNKVLGLTQQYGPDELDSEWAYLSKYGYPSLNAVQQMKYEYNNISFYRHGSLFFKFAGNRLMKYSGITYCLYCNNMICGRLNLLEKERVLNEGDYQILNLLAKMIEPSLGQIYCENIHNNNNVFYNILFGKPYDSKMLDVQMRYQEWNKTDDFQLALVQMAQKLKREEQRSNLDIVMQTIRQNALNCVILKKSPYIFILANFKFTADKVLMQFLKGLAENNPIRIGFSLPCQGITQAGHLYQQAKSALSYGLLSAPDEYLYYFFDYAIDFMLDSPSLSHSVHACLPGLVQLWKMQQESDDDLFTTLKCFLDCERNASRTSAALHTHRNTILYRIQKIQDLLRCSLDDVYVRDYCRLSIRALELYDRKMK